MLWGGYETLSLMIKSSMMYRMLILWTTGRPCAILSSTEHLF